MWNIGTGKLLSFTSCSIMLTMTDTLITSFPQSYTDHVSADERSKRGVKASKQTSTVVSVLEMIEQDLRDCDAQSPVSVVNLASLIINSCARFLDRYRDPPIIRILDNLTTPSTRQ